MVVIPYTISEWLQQSEKPCVNIQCSHCGLIECMTHRGPIVFNTGGIQCEHTVGVCDTVVNVCFPYAVLTNSESHTETKV